MEHNDVFSTVTEPESTKTPWYKKWYTLLGGSVALIVVLVLGGQFSGLFKGSAQATPNFSVSESVALFISTNQKGGDNVFFTKFLKDHSLNFIKPVRPTTGWQIDSRVSAVVLGHERTSPQSVTQYLKIADDGSLMTTKRLTSEPRCTATKSIEADSNAASATSLWNWALKNCYLDAYLDVALKHGADTDTVKVHILPNLNHDGSVLNYSGRKIDSSSNAGIPMKGGRVVAKNVRMLPLEVSREDEAFRTLEKLGDVYRTGTGVFTDGITNQRAFQSNTYFVYPALPAGLSLDSNDGTISGTPTGQVAKRDYIVGRIANGYKFKTEYDCTNYVWPFDECIDTSKRIHRIVGYGVVTIEVKDKGGIKRIIWGDGAGDTDDDADSDTVAVDDADSDTVAVDDADSDTVADTTDNCPLVANANQLDTDDDTQGDACDSTPNGGGTAGDTTGPTITFTPAPLATINVGTNYVIQGTITDPSGVAYLTYTLDDVDHSGAFLEIFGETQSTSRDFTLTFSPLVIGQHTITITVGDNTYAQNLRTITRTVIVTDPNEGYPSDDFDNDAISNIGDNCPTIANPTQLNTDSDTQGNACDTDDDNDIILDTADNCPIVANTSQTDIDDNGVGDACEPTTSHYIDVTFGTDPKLPVVTTTMPSSSVVVNVLRKSDGVAVYTLDFHDAAVLPANSYVCTLGVGCPGMNGTVRTPNLPAGEYYYYGRITVDGVKYYDSSEPFSLPNGFSIQPPNTGASYVDVPANHPAGAAIKYVYDLGIMRGTLTSGGRVFNPEQTLIRSEVFAISNRLSGLTLGCLPVRPNQYYYTPVDGAMNFSDLAGYVNNMEAYWFMSEIKCALRFDKTILRGYPDGTMRPLQQITWAESAKVVLEAARVGQVLNAALPFINQNLNPWWTNYYEFLGRNGLTLPFGNNVITRAQFAQFIYDMGQRGMLNEAKMRANTGV